MTVTDDRATGFTAQPVDPARYESNSSASDPSESSGIILRMIPRGARVLDVGCGAGLFTAIIRDERGAQVVAIEPNLERATRARLEGLDVRHAELTDELLQALGTFDVILFADVLEHLVDPAAVLRLTLAGLRPGGCVIASVPNVAHWTVRLALARGKFEYEPIGIMDATHLRWFTAATIARLFQSCGYRVAEQTVSAGVWLNAYARRPWSWLPIEGLWPVIRWLSKKLPGLFGCQHVIRAVAQSPR